MILGIFGLGLMGGSLSLALKHKRIFTEHIGTAKTQKSAKEALDLGLIDRIASLDELIKTSDCLILAAPVSAIKALLPRLVETKKTATIIDLASTKHGIALATPPEIKSRFVLAHPMCGTEFSGPAAAQRDLYRDSVCVLCNTEQTAQSSLELAERMFLSMDMDLIKMDAASHDHHACFISHLPHVLSFALANSVLKQEDTANILALAAGGFTSMSRLAKSSPLMWRDIFLENKQDLLASMEIFEAELARVKQMLKSGAGDELEEWMRAANRLHRIFKPKQ